MYGVCSSGGVVGVCFFQAEDGIRVCCLSRGLGEVYKRQALRLPLGCAVLFYPSSTPAKWEGTAIPGVFAGYSMKNGYDWKGEYLCWSLNEMTT